MKALIVCFGALAILGSGMFAAVANGAGSGDIWSYTGDTGPAYWGALKDENHLCKEGKRQSPINITTTETTSKSDLAFDLKPVTGTVKNNGHTIQFNASGNDAITVSGTKYKLVQIHFHAPSENRIDGKQYPVEVHLVHKSAAGKLAVIGVMVESGKANPAISAILDAAPLEPLIKSHKVEGPVNVSEFLPPSSAHYSFNGSLTTPPCLEQVKWRVMEEPITFSPEQISRLVALMPKHNARPVQDVNNRDIIKISP
ncbi:carbonic anhydrase [Flexibacterium corallicola]|uniref:carbonic anhydrase n=1 Tax=Flexibacterium corallicola TaxID=3037259 RepID=UPI00286F6203|nr:carbonic anhydrase family protein [Pseudovibrio sp. M1P-2-3]